jgi:hypothetical protein
VAAPARPGHEARDPAADHGLPLVASELGEEELAPVGVELRLPEELAPALGIDVPARLGVRSVVLEVRLDPGRDRVGAPEHGQRLDHHRHVIRAVDVRVRVARLEALERGVERGGGVSGGISHTPGASLGATADRFRHAEAGQTGAGGEELAAGARDRIGCLHRGPRGLSLL